MSEGKYLDGEILIAVRGNRRMIVETREGVKWAVPVVKDFKEMPLDDWISRLIYGARKWMGPFLEGGIR